jgi:hypothetical protein
MGTRIPDLPDLHTCLGGEVDRLDELVREVEQGQRGIPVLLRQYLKLNARALAFNIDPAFSDVLDVLMLVDLRTVDPAILQKYMGRDGAARFRSFHDGTAAGVDRHSAPPTRTPSFVPAGMGGIGPTPVAV